MLLIAFRHGLRASEACSLQWSDVEFESATLRLRRTKGRATATHPLLGDELRALRTLLNAKAVAYTTAGQSGLHFISVTEKLGIAEQIKAKGKTSPGGAVAEFVAKGEADVAIQLIPELASVPGLNVVGPFPAELQTYIVLTDGVSANAKDKAAAQALIKYLTTPAAISVIKSKGMEPG